jgi:hypothetical protein
VSVLVAEVVSPSVAEKVPLALPLFPLTGPLQCK